MNSAQTDPHAQSDALDASTADTRRDAVRWIIENRRPEVTRAQAIKTLRWVLRKDTLAQALLDEIEADGAHAPATPLPASH